MNHVISVSLNGREYRLEKSAHAEMDRYLEDAKRRLKDDPDAEEIIGDLERSFAEKCDKTLQQYRNVITEGDVKEMLQSVGIVESLADQSASSAEPEAFASTNSRPKTSAPTRRKKAVAAAAVLASLFLVCAGGWAYVENNKKTNVPPEPATTEAGPGADTAATATPATPSTADQGGVGEATATDTPGVTEPTPTPPDSGIDQNSTTTSGSGSGIDPTATTTSGAAAGEASTYPECPGDTPCETSGAAGAPADVDSSPIDDGVAADKKG